MIQLGPSSPSGLTSPLSPLVDPMRIDISQLLDDPVVLPQPHCVQPREARLLVDPIRLRAVNFPSDSAVQLNRRDFKVFQAFSIYKTNRLFIGQIKSIKTLNSLDFDNSEAVNHSTRFFSCCQITCNHCFYFFDLL